MPRMLCWQFTLAFLPALRSRLAVAATVLGLLSFALPATLLGRPPRPAALAGTPVGVAIGAVPGRLLVTTFSPNDMVAVDGDRAQLLGGVTLPGFLAGRMAVDSASGHVYVTNIPSSIDVLVGANLTPLATVHLDQLPVDLAANAVTGRIYVATHNIDNGRASDEVVVVDDARASVRAKIPIGVGPLRVAVDPAANLVYVTDDGSDTVTLLAGDTNARLAMLPVGRGPHELAVNAQTGRAYVSNGGSGSVSVLDGARKLVLATLAVAGYPAAVGVNESTNRVYVARGAGDVAVLDGATGQALARLPTGREPAALAVDTTSNRVYVIDAHDSTVWMLQERRWGRPTARVIARGLAPPPLAGAPGDCLC